jgi:hypothetical protein
MIPEIVQTFWAALQRGEFITDAAAEAGTYRKKGARWLAAAGGVRPRRGRDLKGRCCVTEGGAGWTVWFRDQMARASSAKATGSRCCGSSSTPSS